MQLIKPSFEIIKQDINLLGAFRQAELAARTCYKSEDKITDNSWIDLLSKIKNRGHLSPFEFGTIYLTISHTSPVNDINYIKTMDIVKFYSHNKYSKVKKYTKDHYEIFYYITTNLRVILENDRLDDLKYFTNPTDKHEQRICVKFICSRDISHEFVRHRVFSFCQESTRYCNYSRDKFGSEITCIVPSWCNDEEIKKVNQREIIISDDFGDAICEYYYHFTGKEASYFKPYNITLEENFVVSLKISEKLYFELLNQGWKPQQARQVLPNALKTELMMCGYISDWNHFFDLRCSSAAHPSARELAEPLKEEFRKRGYLNV